MVRSNFLWPCDPKRAMVSSFLSFLDHKQRRITVGRTPLDEWSARRRYLYLTTHNTHNRHTSMPPVGFEPTISSSERPQTYALDRAATGTGNCESTPYEIFFHLLLLHFIVLEYFITRYHGYSNISYLFIYLWFILPIPVVVRSRVWVCGRSLAGIADSDPAGRMSVRLFWVLLVS